MKTLTHFAISDKVQGENIGALTIRGYSLISDEDLLELRTKAAGGFARPSPMTTMEVLDLCKDALITPQGRHTTAKAKKAYDAIIALTGGV